MSSRTVAVVRGNGFVAAAAALGLALASTATPARAQYRAAQAMQRPLNFIAGIGATVPTGNAGRALGTGWNVLAGVTLNGSTFPVGVRASASYQRFAAKLGHADSLTAITGGNGELLGGALDATLDLPGSAAARPYVILGAGYYALRARRTVARLVRDPAGDFTVGSTERESDASWGINGGIGMRGGLGALDAFVELRVDNVFTSGGAFGAKQLRVLPLTIGVRF